MIIGIHATTFTPIIDNFALLEISRCSIRDRHSGATLLDLYRQLHRAQSASILMSLTPRAAVTPPMDKMRIMSSTCGTLSSMPSVFAVA